MVSARIADDEKRRVETAIAECERRSAAEIAVVVARASGDYTVFLALWAGGIALVGGALVAAFAGALPSAYLALGQAAAFAALFLLGALSGWAPRLASEDFRQTQTRLLAAHEFAALVAGRTADRRAILVLLSLAEHRIEIVTDQGVAAAIPDGEWQKVVAAFQAEAQDRTVGEALLGVVGRCGDLLAAAFPPSPDQRNELSDRITSR